jgi:hypothetical protein
LAHTINSTNTSSTTNVYQVTITSYTNGTGESFTLAELGLRSQTTPIIPILNPSFRNSLSALIFPIYANGVVKLYQFVSGSPVEVATNASLNAIFDIVVIAVGN